jgi:uncharacterized protein (DUF4213/DUF364 family)
MKIIEDILSTLDHEVPVVDVRQGTFQTAVLTRNCGLATTPHGVGSHHNTNPVKDAGLLMDKDTLTLARMALSPCHQEAAIGMAAINSLIAIEEKRCTEINAAAILAEKGQGKKVAVVGHFPFVNQIYEIAKKLWIIEKHPQEGDFDESHTDKLLPQADVVAITGTTFVNHTLEYLLGSCNPKAYVIILGGTTPMSTVLFDYGINAISGAKVTDPETVLRYISQGATFRQLKGVKRLTMYR